MRSRMLILAILAVVFDLSKRAAVVTGATGNIGQTVIRAYLGQGAHVVAPVRDANRGEALLSALGPLAGSEADPLLMVVSADPADRAAMDRVVERTLRAWGRLDIIANLVGGYAAREAADHRHRREPGGAAEGRSRAVGDRRRGRRADRVPFHGRGERHHRRGDPHRREDVTRSRRRIATAAPP